MAKKRKVNPNRKPATQADVNRAKKEAIEEAVTAAWAIMFTVMRDKFGFGNIRLRRMWDEVTKLSESITQGYVDVGDLEDALREEAGITLRDSKAEGAT